MLDHLDCIHICAHGEIVTLWDDARVGDKVTIKKTSSELSPIGATGKIAHCFMRVITNIKPKSGRRYRAGSISVKFEESVFAKVTHEILVQVTCIC